MRRSVGRVDPLHPAGSAAEVVTQLRGWLDGPEDVPLVVPTSGSTGRPKQVSLSRRAVLASGEATERRLGGSGRWVLRLPPTFIAGVQVLVRSLVAGYDPVVDPDGPWPQQDGWFTSLVPTQLARVLEDPAQTAALARAHTVLLGGGPIDPAVRRRAEAAGIRIVATYGSAETAGGCIYDGLPLDGVSVETGEGGRVRVAGHTLFDGYLDDPVRTAEVLVDGWFLTSDAGRIEDGRLQLIGRLDDIVVTGGLNVPAPAVATRLRAHEAVREAEALGVPDPEWGNRLVAFVVPHAGATVGLDVLRDWVGAAHPRAWAPRQLLVLDAIPLLGNGKPDRLALREIAMNRYG